MFKIAILQKRAVNAQIDENVESIIMAMKEASENHADILLLPECFVTGYDLPMTYEKSIADDDIRITKICENAKKYKIGVVLTAFTKGNKQPQNSAFVIDKSGNILMKYSKVHTCDFADERNVESGKEFKVCDFEGIQLGIMSKLMSHQTNEATDIRFLVLYYSMMLGRMHMLQDQVEKLQLYPYISHDDVRMQMIRPLIRASDGIYDRNL